MSSLPSKKFGKSQLLISVLGIGTTWFGRPWPPENTSYRYPDFEEISNYLDAIFAKIGESRALLMIDTAAAYGLSEKRIGEYFNNRKKLLPKAFIATKWGEEFDIEKGISTLNHSKGQMLASVKRSLSFLRKIDLLYIHRVSNEALLNCQVISTMKQLKEQHYAHIRYIGASFSNESTLEDAVRENLIDWPDVIQMPASVFLKRPDLADTLLAKKISIVLNSPVRKGGNLSPQDIYTTLLQHGEISVILTGTRRHLKETIGYFCNSK